VAASKPRVYLIDASIYIFRAWYSVPDDLVNSAGHPINALHGFAGFLAGFLEQAKPQHLAVVFDESLTTSFRNDIYPDYKANREPAPPELKQQFAYCRTLVQSLGLADFSSKTYEADDLIGTLADPDAGTWLRNCRVECRQGPRAADRGRRYVVGLCA